MTSSAARRGRDQPLPGAHRDGFRCGSRRNRLVLAASPHDEAASGRRERYPGALTGKGHGGRGPVEQVGRLLKSSDAAIDAKGHDEKNNGGLETFSAEVRSVTDRSRLLIQHSQMLS
jgi:hypothetical protein